MELTFYPGTQNILPAMIPHVFNRSFTISADLEVLPGGAEGVIVAENSSSVASRSTFRTASPGTPTASWA